MPISLETPSQSTIYEVTTVVQQLRTAPVCQHSQNSAIAPQTVDSVTVFRSPLSTRTIYDPKHEEMSERVKRPVSPRRGYSAGLLTGGFL